MPQKNSLRFSLFICLLLVASVGVTFSQTTTFNFVSLDDNAYVRENPDIRKGLSLRGVESAFTSTRGSMYIPLTWLSFMADYEIFGMNPGGFHLTNVLFHLINSILLFFLLQKLTKAPWPSAIVAVIFAVHPTRVESVAWVTERKDVLYAFFWFIAVRAYVHYTERPGFSRYLPVFVIMIFSCLAKPMAVTLPAVLLLYDIWPLGRIIPDSLKDPSSRKRIGLVFAEKIPLFLVSLTVSLIAIYIMKKDANLFPVEQLSVGARLENSIVSYTGYIRMFFYPSGLAPFYPIPAEGYPLWKVVGSGLLLAALFFSGLALIRRRAYLFCGFVSFFVMLLPVSGFFQNGDQVMADRFAYLPLTGLAMMVAFPLASILGLEKNTTGKRAVLGVILLISLTTCLSFLSYGQTALWKDSKTLYRHVLNVVGDSGRFHSLLGDALAEEALNDQKVFDEALGHFKKSMILNPSLGARLDIGRLYEKKGDIHKAKEWYEADLKYNPKKMSARYHLGRVLDKTGSHEEAVKLFREILAKDPKDRETRNALGVALVSLSRSSEAEAEFEKALALEPKYAEARVNLGVLLMEKGNIKDALFHFITAQQDDPLYAPAFDKMGLALFKIGRFDYALKFYGKALALAPNSPGIHNNIGLLYVAMGQPEKAKARFQKALEISPGFTGAARNIELLSKRQETAKNK